MGLTPSENAQRRRGGADQALSESLDFATWRDGLPSFEADGDRLYLPTGDVPMDEAQLADHWRQAVRYHREGTRDQGGRP